MFYVPRPILELVEEFVFVICESRFHDDLCTDDSRGLPVVYQLLKEG